MNSILRPLALALLAGVCSAQFGSPKVHLDVESGRAILVTNQGVQPLTAQRGVAAFAGPGHLEVAPGSRALLRWQGMGSLSLRGPASVAWQTAEASGVQLEFGAIGTVDIEVRGHSMRVDLPGAWRLNLETGAYSVYSRGGGGGMEFIHRAGHRARATWVGGEGLAPPPTLVHAGQQLRMQGAPEVLSRPDTTPAAPGWSRMSWPWGEGRIEGVPDLSLSCAPAWGEKQWPWGVAPVEGEAWERWDWPWVAPQPESQPQAPVPSNEQPHGTQTLRALPADPTWRPSPVMPEAQAAEQATSVELIAEDEPTLEDGPDVSTTVPSGLDAQEIDAPLAAEAELSVPGGPQVATTSISPKAEPQSPPVVQPHEPRKWRELGAEQIEDFGNYRLQAGTELQRDPRPNGDVRLSLDAKASEPCWYFSRRLDVRIFPGASLVIGQDGYLRYHTGTVRILSGSPGRSF